MKKIVIDIYPKRNSKEFDRYFLDDKDEVVIGRSFASDLSIDDPYVSGEHVKVSITSSLQITDLNSENGTKVNNKNIQDETITIQSGDKVKIGHTRLRVYSATHELEPTKKIGWAVYARDFLNHNITALILFILACVLHPFHEWLLSTDISFLEEQVYKVAFEAVILLFTVGFVIYIAFLLSKHPMKFTGAISYTALIVILDVFFSLLSEVSLSSSLNLTYTLSMTSLSSAIGFALIALLMMYMHGYMFLSVLREKFPEKSRIF